MKKEFSEAVRMSELEEEKRDEIDKKSHELFNEYGDEWGNCFFNKKEAFQIGFWRGYSFTKEPNFEGIKQEPQKTREKLEKAEEDSVFLGFLEECGVDNWDGYSDAWKLTKKYFKDKQGE